MARIVPHDQIFKRGKLFDKYGTLLIYASSLISILLIAIPNLTLEIKLLLNAMNCTFIFIIIIFDLVFNYIFFVSRNIFLLTRNDSSCPFSCRGPGIGCSASCGFRNGRQVRT